MLTTAWYVLFFVQTLLINSGRRAVHQKLGIGDLFLAAGVVVSGVTAIFLTPAIARIWGWSGGENTLEFWVPMTENGLAVLIIGGDG